MLPVLIVNSFRLWYIWCRHDLKEQNCIVFAEVVHSVSTNYCSIIAPTGVKYESVFVVVDKIEKDIWMELDSIPDILNDH